MKIEEMKIFLDEKVELYNTPKFIDEDPIQIPHRFSKLQDIEISAFLTATISWGNRKSILKDAEKMLNFMEYSPYDFITNFSNKDIQKLQYSAIHRTFNADDFIVFLKNLQRLYQQTQSLESYLVLKEGETNYYHALQRFRNSFFESTPEDRSRKHISSTYKNSSAKRLVMFLRWMIRKDRKGVDFGLWEKSPQKYLSVPLDVHTGTIARKLELISRKQNDWKTVEQMDEYLRILDPEDPAKYDFALFGLGVTGELL